MDFAKVDVYTHNFQIMHVIVYSANNVKKYLSYIGDQGEHNDKWFVVYVFNHYLLPELAGMPQWQNFSIFCDGGNHFKSSQMLMYFRTLCAFIAPRHLYLNFYASYHGANGCDGLAAHAAGSCLSLL